MVPSEKFAPYTSMLSAVFATALLLGPLLGGVINNYTSWRWVFLIKWVQINSLEEYCNDSLHSVPAGAVSIILVLITIPRNFPHHGIPPSLHQTQTLRRSSLRAQLLRADFVGTTLLLSATVFLVTAFEEAGVQYQWHSAFIIAVLVVSAVSWIAFLAWSRKITHMEGLREPVFPWRFVESRVCMALLVYSSLPSKYWDKLLTMGLGTCFSPERPSRLRSSRYH